MRIERRPVARNDLAYAELDGEGLAYDARSGQLHYLGPTARVVFRLADGSATVLELTSEIAEAYDIDPVDVEVELESLLRDLDEARLLETDAPGVDLPTVEPERHAAGPAP